MISRGGGAKNDKPIRKKPKDGGRDEIRQRRVTGEESHGKERANKKPRSQAVPLQRGVSGIGWETLRGYYFYYFYFYLERVAS